MVTTLIAEGWCTDPFGRHEARWLSAGSPTALVRNRGIESTDPVPAGLAPLSAEPLDWGQKGQAGADLLRSDRAVRTPTENFSHLCSTMLRGGSD